MYLPKMLRVEVPRKLEILPVVAMSAHVRK